MLPDKPSDLIELALSDLEKCEKDDGTYQIEMGEWHTSPVDRLPVELPHGFLATKICRACKREQGIDQFSRDRSRADGLAWMCRQCVKVGTKKLSQKRAVKLKPGLLELSQRDERRAIIRLQTEEARRQLREEEEERDAPSPAQIKFMATALKLLRIREMMEQREVIFNGFHGMQNEDWRDPFPGIKFIPRKQTRGWYGQLCDCPYWQHEIQHEQARREGRYE